MEGSQCCCWAETHSSEDGLECVGLLKNRWTGARRGFAGVAEEDQGNTDQGDEDYYLDDAAKTLGFSGRRGWRRTKQRR